MSYYQLLLTLVALLDWLSKVFGKWAFSQEKIKVLRVDLGTSVKSNQK